MFVSIPILIAGQNYLVEHVQLVNPSLLIPTLLLILSTTTKLQVETILHQLSVLDQDHVKIWLALEDKEVNMFAHQLLALLIHAKDLHLIVQKEDVKITFADL
jgi:hypothetical protein